MFCKNCGQEVNDKAVVCIHCGCSLEEKKETVNTVDTSEANESKTTIGVLMGLFLGLIGLIIGICLYKEGTVARKTFLKGFWIAFGISMAISIIVGIIYGVAVGSMLGSYYYY